MEMGLITFTPFYVPCHMTYRGGGAARCRVKAAVRHTPRHKWCSLLFKTEKKKGGKKHFSFFLFVFVSIELLH